MSTFLNPGETVAHSSDDERAARRKASIVTVLFLLALFGAAFLVWLSTRTDETDALRDIPSAQRHALFEATRHTLQSVCEPTTRPSGLDQYCTEQAQFILKFDACDAECQELSQRSRPQPRR